jgi:hypothetical protein
MLQNSRFIGIHRAFNTAKIALFGSLSEGRTKDGMTLPIRRFKMLAMGSDSN